MHGRRGWTVAAVLVLCLAAPARADTDKMSEAVNAGGLTKLAAKAVITCVRPSTALAKKGHKPRVLAHNYGFPGGGRVELTVKMRFHGAVTRKPYDADFTIKLQVNKDGAEVVGVDYADNCRFPPPDQRLLNLLVGELNKQLRVQ